MVVVTHSVVNQIYLAFSEPYAITISVNNGSQNITRRRDTRSVYI